MNQRPRHYPPPSTVCNAVGHAGRCRRKASFPSGRCGVCEEAAQRRDFAVLDSYLEAAACPACSHSPHAGKVCTRYVDRDEGLSDLCLCGQVPLGVLT